MEKFRNAFAICSDSHRWARLSRLGGRALLRVSLYSVSIYIVGGGGRVYVILNILLIFLEIVYFACYLVR